MKSQEELLLECLYKTNSLKSLVKNHPDECHSIACDILEGKLTLTEPWHPKQFYQAVMKLIKKEYKYNTKFTALENYENI